LALAGFHPGSIGELGVEGFDESAGGDAVLSGRGEEQKNVQQKRPDRIVFACVAGEGEGGFAGASGPVAAGAISNSEEWFPDVGSAIV
jgi:hypothetical protein